MAVVKPELKLKIFNDTELKQVHDFYRENKGIIVDIRSRDNKTIFVTI